MNMVAIYYWSIAIFLSIISVLLGTFLEILGSKSTTVNKFLKKYEDPYDPPIFLKGLFIGFANLFAWPLVIIVILIYISCCYLGPFIDGVKIERKEK